MDAQVIAAMARWPDVPDVYGWLSLSVHGQWCIHPGGRAWAQTNTPLANLAAPDLAGEPITNTQFIEFIDRNYAADAAGRWYFQNGPQRVYVRLDAAPYLLRLDLDAQGNPLLRTHTGLTAGQVHGWWHDEQGRIFAACDVGPGLIAGRDLPAVLDTLHTLDGPLTDILMASTDEKPKRALTIQPWPPTTEGPSAMLRLIAAADIPRTLGFVACPQAAKG